MTAALEHDTATTTPPADFVPPDTLTLDGVEYEHMADVPVIPDDWRGAYYHVFYNGDADDAVKDVVLLDESGAVVRDCETTRFEEIRNNVTRWREEAEEARDLAAKERAESRSRDVRAVDAFSGWWR